MSALLLESLIHLSARLVFLSPGNLSIALTFISTGEEQSVTTAEALTRIITGQKNFCALLPAHQRLAFRHRFPGLLLVICYVLVCKQLALGVRNPECSL